MNNSPHASTPANILVVDDTPAHLNLLVEMLSHFGYHARPAPNGRLALLAAEIDRLRPSAVGHRYARDRRI